MGELAPWSLDLLASLPVHFNMAARPAYDIYGGHARGYLSKPTCVVLTGLRLQVPRRSGLVGISRPARRSIEVLLNIRPHGARARGQKLPTELLQRYEIAQLPNHDLLPDLWF
jgi:hypothetical protein